MVKEIVVFLLEDQHPDESDVDLKELTLGPEHEEYELWQIKAAEPVFFSRKTMKFHGTRKIYKYRGNYVVLHNVKRMGGHAFGVGDWTLDQYVIYQYVKTKDSPEGILLYRGTTKDLSDAKQMIKSGDFTSRRQKLGLPESEEDDLEAALTKEVNVMADMEQWQEHGVLRKTEFFALVRFQNGKIGLVCLFDGHPQRVPVTEKDAEYLMSGSPATFDASAVMDFGCGVWKEPDPKENLDGG